MIDTDKYEGHKTAPWRWWSGRLLADADNYGLPLFQLNGEPNELDSPDVHLIADAPLLLEEVKRLRKLEAAVVGSWMETINRGSSWHKQLRYPCVELGYLELRDVERILHVGNGKTITHTSPEFHLKEEYEEMAKQWIKEEYGVEEE